MQAVDGFGDPTGSISVFEFIGWEEDSHNHFGTFGDFVGGVLNPFFGFFTLLGLLWTIYMQRVELNYSREELIETRKEVKRSADAFEVQNFDNTFFNLLNSLEVSKLQMKPSSDKSIRDLVLSYSMDIREANEGRYVVVWDLVEPYGFKREDATHQPDLVELGYVHQFVQKNYHLLGHYFYSLMNIYRFIETEGQKIEGFSFLKYQQILASSLSPEEICLIFFFSLTEEGKRMKGLCEDHGLLEKLPAWVLASSKCHFKLEVRNSLICMFDKSAYGDNPFWMSQRGDALTRKMIYVERRLKS